MSDICYTNEISAEDLAQLYASVGWSKKANLDRCKKALGNTAIVFSAYNNEKAIGVLRLATDYAFFAHVMDILVHPDWQREGIGGELLSRVVRFCNEQGFEENHGELTLFAAKDVDRFFSICNFNLVGNGMHYRFHYESRSSVRIKKP